MICLFNIEHKILDWNARSVEITQRGETTHSGVDITHSTMINPSHNIPETDMSISVVVMETQYLPSRWTHITRGEGIRTHELL